RNTLKGRINRGIEKDNGSTLFAYRCSRLRPCFGIHSGLLRESSEAIRNATDCTARSHEARSKRSRSRVERVPKQGRTTVEHASKLPRRTPEHYSKDFQWPPEGSAVDLRTASSEGCIFPFRLCWMTFPGG